MEGSDCVFAQGYFCRFPQASDLSSHDSSVDVYHKTPNDLYFWRSAPQNKAFSNQNKGHLGSTRRYMFL